MKKTIIVTLVLLSIISCSSDKSKALEHYRNAKEFYYNDDIKNASSEIDIAIALDSTNPDFQITKADIIAETENYELAIEILKPLLIKNFKVDTVNHKIGLFYSDLGLNFTLNKMTMRKVKRHGKMQ
jgi:tetratricopeptide (TPR) repeat protein